MNHFKEMGKFSGPNFGELNVCADNCSGKKKNKITTRYTLWLVDIGVFSYVTLFFLSRKHK